MGCLIQNGSCVAWGRISKIEDKTYNTRTEANKPYKKITIVTESARSRDKEGYTEKGIATVLVFDKALLNLDLDDVRKGDYIVAFGGDVTISSSHDKTFYSLKADVIYRPYSVRGRYVDRLYKERNIEKRIPSVEMEAGENPLEQMNR